MTQGTSDFSFTALMAQRARELALSLDSDQQALVAQLDALGRRLLARSAAPGKGLYVWGRTGRGKSLLVDSFFAACRWRLSAGCTSTLFFANCISA
ncbi:AFG1-like ATPase [Raoultella terrigena]|uniref:AFG1-like ATPase n=1 Tax=Raoultella terrigena TaxID=577 RepID=A0A4U9CVS7_RAOTE|nr:AFG1-like ATPase [Raoultella terrigena]